MNTNKLHNNINTNGSGYQLVMPLNIEMMIEAEESVRTLYAVTERMDYRELTATYQRQPAYGEATPKQLFQIVILGFMLGVYSTRKIESACRNDIRFRYILAGKRTPEHSRIARFIKDHLQGGVAERLFYQLVEMLAEYGEIEFENLFADGTKIEANANRYSFVWAKSTSKYDARTNQKLASMLERLRVEYGIVCRDDESCLQALHELKQKHDVIFVYGRGKRKPQLQRDMEELEDLLTRKEKYAKYNEIFKGRNSFSKTDKDATFMRMKEDHMKNGQLKPGYNLQIGVEGGYIVGAHICSERSDELALLGLLEKMDAALGKRHENVVLDAGYESEENYKLLQGRSQTAYIKPQNYERSKKRKYKRNPYLTDNMAYNPQTDSYACPEGKTFERKTETTRKSKSGFEAAVTVYECSSCEGCPKKALCTRAQGNRQIQVSRDFLALREASLERITSQTGVMLRLNRTIQVEGVFGVLKQDYGFRRFLRRGECNVYTEFMLYAIAYNINKIHNKMSENVSGCTIYQVDSA